MLTGKTKEEVRESIGRMLDIMINASKIALDKTIKSVSNLTGGDAKKVNMYAKSDHTICGSTINMAIARALSYSEANAAMEVIVAAPTAGSCGIVPAAIISGAEVMGADKEKMIDALLTAAGVGQIIARNATLSGAKGGCQA